MGGGASEPELAAGAFSAWAHQMRAAMRGEGPALVPCDGCSACCTSSQFVHIAPDETETLSRIPSGLLFPAPGRPRGHVVLGYDERGRCPMLAEDRCSIYEYRPLTCRTYDCRIFPAAGVDADHPGQARITIRARRWRFDYPTPGDRARHDAVRAAAAFLAEHGDVLPEGAAVVPARRAAVAVQVHELFLGGDEGGAGTPVGVPDPEAVRREVARQSAAVGGPAATVRRRRGGGRTS